MSDIHDEHPQCVQKALKIEWFLVVYNLLEAGLSIFFGASAGSVALVGFGLDSVIEAAAAGILIRHFSRHSTEAEEARSEKRALSFVAVTFFLLAAYIAVESGIKLLRKESPHPSIAGVVIAVLSILLMPFFGRAKKKIAGRIGSKALEADATETMICAFLSAILLGGLGLNVLFGWWWADPAAGLLMAVFIVKEGLEVFRESRGMAHGH